jgi:hypothetical protein
LGLRSGLLSDGWVSRGCKFVGGEACAKLPRILGRLFPAWCGEAAEVQRLGSAPIPGRRTAAGFRGPSDSVRSSGLGRPIKSTLGGPLYRSLALWTNLATSANYLEVALKATCAQATNVSNMITPEARDHGPSLPLYRTPLWKPSRPTMQL